MRSRTPIASPATPAFRLMCRCSLAKTCLGWIRSTSRAVSKISCSTNSGAYPNWFSANVSLSCTALRMRLWNAGSVFSRCAATAASVSLRRSGRRRNQTSVQMPIPIPKRIIPMRNQRGKGNAKQTSAPVIVHARMPMHISTPSEKVSHRHVHLTVRSAAIIFWYASLTLTF